MDLQCLFLSPILVGGEIKKSKKTNSTKMNSAIKSHTHCQLNQGTLWPVVLTLTREPPLHFLRFWRSTPKPGCYETWSGN